MNHTGSIVMETDRLILRPFQLEDAQTMFDNWANNEEVTRYMTWNPHGKVEVTQSIIQSWLEGYKDDDYYLWAICLKNQEVIGSISATKPHEKIKSSEIGYCIGQDWWGQGMTAEAFRAVIDLLFNQVGLNRIYAYHSAGNPNSGRVMEKCGLKKEGYLRQADLDNQGQLIDKVLYSILASEYQD